MPKPGKVDRRKSTPRVPHPNVSQLLYLYVMLTPDEKREFNRKMKVLRDNSGTLADLADRWRAQMNSAPKG